jgi:hypothetical protein
MDSNAETEQPIDKRCRAMHPERITVGSTTFERNDVTAARFGVTERTLNTGDKRGAPFQYFGGVKYRPLPDYDEFILSGIRRQQPLQPKRHRRSRAPPRRRSRKQFAAHAAEGDARRNPGKGDRA